MKETKDPEEHLFKGCYSMNLSSKEPTEASRLLCSMAKNWLNTQLEVEVEAIY